MSLYLPQTSGPPVAAAETVPATPLDDDGFTGLLCDEAHYAIYTGDTTSTDPALTEALTDAQNDVAIACNRTLLFGHYSEMLYVYKNGYAYPSAVPIAETIQPEGAYQQGFGLWVGFFLPLPSMPVWTGVLPPQTMVEYWGGFDDTTCPGKLKRLIAKVAWHYLNPVALPGVPPGAKSANAGGVTVSGTGDLSTLEIRDLSIKRDIEAFKRPQAMAWQS